MDNRHKENIIETLIEDIVYGFDYYKDSLEVYHEIELARKKLERMDFQDDISPEMEGRKLAEKIFISCKF